MEMTTGWRVAGTTLTLAPDEIHIWRVRLNETEGESERFYSTLLTEDEQVRADRFHYRKDKTRWIISRASLRRLLADYLDTTPADLLFQYNVFGKPYLEDDNAPDIRFNVSHSGDFALFAFTRGREVGVDLEQERNDFDADSILQIVFSPDEMVALRATPPNERTGAFYAVWVCKEAYVKAIGQGLSFPLNELTTSVDRTTGEVRMDRSGVDHGQVGLHVRLLDVAPGFAAAFAVEGGELNALSFWEGTGKIRES